MLSEIQRYLRNLLPSSVTPARGDRTGALVTIPAHSFYSEMVYQGNVWVLNTPQNGTTISAANVIATSTIQPILGFYNMPQSGYILSVHRINSMWCSGNAGPGGLVWGYVAPGCNITSPSDNAEINLATMQSGGSPFKTFSSNVALSGVTDSKLLRLLGGPSTGNIGGNANHSYTEECSGDIFCPPGGFLGLFVSSTGTAVVRASIVFEAIPV